MRVSMHSFKIRRLISSKQGDYSPVFNAIMASYSPEGFVCLTCLLGVLEEMYNSENRIEVHLNNLVFAIHGSSSDFDS